MMPVYVALTTITDRVRFEDIARVAAALQTQVVRDFAPYWHTPAIVAAFPFEVIPSCYRPIILYDAPADSVAAGFHRTRADDAPYIMVPYGPTWSLAASNELLRMLADPCGSARQAAPSHLPGQGDVEYLIDVTGPCQSPISAYAIDGLPVSNFCLPSFFQERSPAAAVALDFTDSVKESFRPAAGGSITWLADDGLIYQARADVLGRTRIHGGFSCANRNRLLLREFVDTLTPGRLRNLATAPMSQRLLDAEQNARRTRLTNLLRYQDDMSWRFGQLKSVVVPLELERETPSKSRKRSYEGASTPVSVAAEDILSAARTVS